MTIQRRNKGNNYDEDDEDHSTDYNDDEQRLAYDRLVRRIERMTKEVEEGSGKIHDHVDVTTHVSEYDSDTSSRNRNWQQQTDSTFINDRGGFDPDSDGDGDGVWDEYRDEMAKQLAFCMSFTENCQRRRYAGLEQRKNTARGFIDRHSSVSVALDSDVPPDGPKLPLSHDAANDMTTYEHQSRSG
jgi:hypothetical protein